MYSVVIYSIIHIIVEHVIEGGGFEVISTTDDALVREIDLVY